MRPVTTTERKMHSPQPPRRRETLSPRAMGAVLATMAISTVCVLAVVISEALR
jgi:hypothetical protein